MDEFSLWRQIAQRFRTSCSEFDGLWIKRRRRFDTESVVKALMQLVGGSQTSYAQVMDLLPQKDVAAPAASSFCAARKKLPAFLLAELRHALLDRWDDLAPPVLWHGRRLFVVDGTKVFLPQPLGDEGFKRPTSGNCPQALVSLLLRLGDRTICDIKLSSNENERTQAHEHLTQLSRGDLTIYDRGYMSFALLTDHVERQVDAVFRVSKGAGFLPIQRFWRQNSTDTIVTLDPTIRTYRSIRNAHPETDFGPIKIRLIKYRIGKKRFVLATTILDQTIKREEFADLYARRWAAEETFKSLKQTLAMESFHAKNFNGVEQEVGAMALLWNLTMILGKTVGSVLKKTPASVAFHHIATRLIISRVYDMWDDTSVTFCAANSGKSAAR